jgi:hypothetical protein
MKRYLCKVEGCDELVVAKGYCTKHYFNHWMQGLEEKTCNYGGGKCLNHQFRRGYCRAHYNAMLSKTRCMYLGCKERRGSTGFCEDHKHVIQGTTKGRP